MAESSLGRKGLISAYSSTELCVTKGRQSRIWRQELMQRLALSGRVQPVFIYHPGPPARGGHAHSDLGPPTSAID